jgi:hypothetical protein
VFKDIPFDKMAEVMFSNLILSMSSAAMIGLGKTPSPASGKIEKDLDLAELNIEMLKMLEEKTKNNLSEREEVLLTTTLTNLKLTYANELKK